MGSANSKGSESDMNSDFAEYMFVNTIADIKEKLARGEPYFLIRGAGLLRHLLLDPPRLIDVVRRKYELRIKYRVQRTKGSSGGGTDLSKLYYSMDTLYLPPGMPPAPGTEEALVNHDQFIKMQCYSFDGYKYSVRDVITYAATFRHGIHSRTAKTDKEKAFIEVDELGLVRSMGFDTHGRTLSDLLEIVIEATQPLCDKINESHAA